MSGVATSDTHIKDVCEYTGLSESAVCELQKIQALDNESSPIKIECELETESDTILRFEDEAYIETIKQSDILNEIIEEPEFAKILTDINRFVTRISIESKFLCDENEYSADDILCRHNDVMKMDEETCLGDLQSDIKCEKDLLLYYIQKSFVELVERVGERLGENNLKMTDKGEKLYDKINERTTYKNMVIYDGKRKDNNTE